MSDSLRDRIAAVLASKEVVLDGWDYINQECCWLLADAVIAELGLHLESRRAHDGSGYVISRPSGEIISGSKPGTRQTRFVTDWKADDE